MADWPYGTATWQRLRSRKLMLHPLCEACQMRGQVTPACAVDHVIAINRGGEAFPPLDGLMALCTSCHSEKTRAMDMAGGKGVRFKGAALTGAPIDPSHPFYREADPIPPARTETAMTRTAVPPTNILSSGPDLSAPDTGGTSDGA